ncbi:MAG: polysaccharide deacetylase family protein [Chitinophagaceae bacterium]|nr:polysaccharide deacetylase family protein [Chitinophagaceae bacterium]
MLFYSDTISPRLRYIVEFFSAELFDEPVELTSDEELFRQSSGPRINYSKHDFSEKEFFVSSTSLLFEKDIRQQTTDCFEVNFHKAFFATRGDFPFDIFAASFYLISRYEEYLPHELDEFGRYAHTNSLAFREGFLNQPLVNIWLADFKKALLRKFPELIFRHRQFTCLLTYDVDIAYSYRNKGFRRNAAGFVRSGLKGNWSEILQRMRVLRGKEKDPYDCFEWLDALHLYCRIKPYYFFLVAKKRGTYDKNISTRRKAFREMIEYYAKQYKIGLHSSWQSNNDPRLLKEEKEWLEVVTETSIAESRQHYLKFNVEKTFAVLQNCGIEKEFSMGYGTTNGFRASICSSYLWYDLKQEQSTDLVIYPFCFMDANAIFEQKLTPSQGYDELIHYYELVKKYNGIFISIWHNHLLTSEAAFAGWREAFELFMKETVYWDAYYDKG